MKMESLKLPLTLYQKHSVSGVQVSRPSAATKSREQNLEESDQSLNMRDKKAED